MKKTMKRAHIVYVLIAAFLCGVIFLGVEYALNAPTWATDRANTHIFTRGIMTTAGKILDRNGEILAETKNGKRVFSDSPGTRKACLHIVGDTSGFISTGTHSFYRSQLSGYNFFDGIYGLKHGGRESNITLNIDSEANRIAFESFGEYNGTIAVCNYKTGELVCSVSKPTYDVNNVPEKLRTSPEYEGVFLDKAVSGIYTPGSIMKIVTAACALENIPDIGSRKFECKGEFSTSDGTIICTDKHGTISFQQAFNQSCNCAFGQIALELGAEKLTSTAEALGFNRSLSAKEIPLVKSRFHPKASSKADTAWAGIGQSTTYVNPIHFLSVMNAIANGGTGFSPDRIKTMGFAGEFVGRIPETMVKMNPETAAELKTMLRNAVRDKYGDDRFPDLKMCGKTGTAEIEGKKSTSVFVGFSSREDLPLAVICFAEEAGWGSGAATRISNAVLQYFLKYYA
ncbi:MAG: penicillin-binding protein [Clostridia bacterium]|nr:penicillin-binding protein [Clostridia bacterium]